MGFDILEGTFKTTTPFIERCFTLSPHDHVRASFSLPELMKPRLWRCSYLMAWPTHELADEAYGLDGMQALLLAMECIHRILLAEAAYREDVAPPEEGMSALMWLGQRDLGLPLPGTVSTGALHAHLLKDAQEGGGDLDHIILKECTLDYRKVARVAATALNAIGAPCRSAKLYGDIGNNGPVPLLDAVLLRLDVLIAAGVLEVQGDLSRPRYSEVRRIPG